MKFFEYLFKEIIIFIVLALVIVVPIRLFVAQPFVVDGESMHPTFEIS
jgi:signal peptidase I